MSRKLPLVRSALVRQFGAGVKADAVETATKTKTKKIKHSAKKVAVPSKPNARYSCV